MSTPSLYVEGPYRAVVVYSAQYNKYVYLFFDVHEIIDPQNVCGIAWADWIFKECRDAPTKEIDVFLETFLVEQRSHPLMPSFRTPIPHYGHGYLFGTTIEKLLKCFDTPRRCVVENIRLHAADTRFDSSYGLVTEFRKFESRLPLFGDYAAKNLFTVFYQDTGFLSNPGLADQWIDLMDAMLLESNANYNWTLPAGEPTRVRLEELFKLETVRLASSCAKNFIEFGLGKATLGKLLTKMTNLMAHFMDIHLMINLFNGAVSHAVVYVGGWHARNYLDYLEIVGFQRLASVGEYDGEIQCLDMQPLTPLFTRF